MWNIFHFVYHTKKNKLGFSHTSIIKSPAQLKITSKLRFQLARHLGRSSNPRFLFLCYSETKETSIGTKGTPNVPLKGGKYWTKTLETINQMPVEAKNVEKESEPLAAGSCRNAPGEGSPCRCLLQTLNMHWPLSAYMGCWVRQAFVQAQYIYTYTPVTSKNGTTVRENNLAK